jgi:hypothetical protein
MIDETTSMADIAGAVANALQALGYEAVVVGGSAATLHAPEAYRSADVDMVVLGGIDDRATFIAKMASIGFFLKTACSFTHRTHSQSTSFRHL